MEDTTQNAPKCPRVVIAVAVERRILNLVLEPSHVQEAAGYQQKADWSGMKERRGRRFQRRKLLHKSPKVCGGGHVGDLVNWVPGDEGPRGEEAFFSSEGES